MGREIVYNNYKDVAYVSSLSDDIRFTQCMKLYKAFDNIKDLENALTDDAKEKISKI